MITITRLVWGPNTEYEAGADRGVFYPKTGSGEVWNGLTSVVESPSSSDEGNRYLDGVKSRHRRNLGFLDGTIEAISYPNSFYSDILVQKRAKPFGMSYRTKTADSYKIHLVYNVLVSPSAYVHRTSVETYSWSFTSLPVDIPYAVKSAHLIIEAKTAYSWTIAALEDVLYGTDEAEASLPLPTEIFDIFEANSILQIIDNGDGTWTAIGPDDVITMLDSTTFQIDWPSAVYIDANSYTIHSL